MEKYKKKQIKKVLNLYSGSILKKFHGWIRFIDSPYIEAEKLIPRKGTIVDMGCGKGYFSNYLGISSPRRKVLGVDIDEDRLSIADKKVPNVKFECADITKYSIPKCDCIVFFHVLHHLDLQKYQKSLLEKCRKSLRKGGKLVIVEIDAKLSLKYFFSLLVDHYIVCWFFDKKFYEKNIFFKSKKEWLDLFRDLGFKSQAIACEKWKPFTNIIFYLEKGK